MIARPGAALHFNTRIMRLPMLREDFQELGREGKKARALRYAHKRSTNAY
jgi:hypothetical protein